MQQKYVYLHTRKNLKQTEKILENSGMEIIFKSDDIALSLNELSVTETIAWFEECNKVIQRTLKRVDSYKNELVTFKKNIESAGKNISELVKLYHNDPNGYKTNEKYELCLKKMRKASNNYSYRTAIGFALRRTLRITTPISCSCLIAKKGSNVVRYLEFHENKDPILTITGPKATYLKTSLEKKF